MRAWGPSTVYLAGMPCGGLHAAGMVGSRSGRGWPSTVVRGVWCQALCLSRLPVSGGGQPGPVARVSRPRVVWVWGTQHRPHSARSCEPALRAVGVAGGRLWRGALRRCERWLWSGARPPPAARRLGGLSGGEPGAVARVSRARVVWVWGTQHRPHSAHSCKPAVRAVGPAGGCSLGGVPCAVVRGV